MFGKLGWMGVFSFAVALGQAPVAPPATPLAAASAPAKPLAFEVISIRQNVAPPQSGPMQFGPTADGYHAVGIPLYVPMLTAYVPAMGAAFYTQDHVTGFPGWAEQDRFDIDAKIADEDRAEWQKPGSQKAMLQQMMQALLVERCKMVVHREVKEVAVYTMVVGKNGPKFKPTNPDEKHEGMKLPFGGIMSEGKDGMELYAAPMQSLATLLSSRWQMGEGRQIQDKTGLTGLYDIVVPRNDVGQQSQETQGTTSASDPGGGETSVLESLGLKLVPAKGQVETLVIDHIERPSAN